MSSLGWFYDQNVAADDDPIDYQSSPTKEMLDPEEAEQLLSWDSKFALRSNQADNRFNIFLQYNYAQLILSSQKHQI